MPPTQPTFSDQLGSLKHWDDLLQAVTNFEQKFDRILHTHPKLLAEAPDLDIVNKDFITAQYEIINIKADLSEYKNRVGSPAPSVLALFQEVDDYLHILIVQRAEQRKILEIKRQSLS